MGEASRDSNEVRLPEAALDRCRTVSPSRGRFEQLDEQGTAQQQLLRDEEQGMRRSKDARWSADCKGFSLHAGVSVGEPDRRDHLELAPGDRFGVEPATPRSRTSTSRVPWSELMRPALSRSRPCRAITPYHTLSNPFDFAMQNSLSMDSGVVQSVVHGDREVVRAVR